MVDANFYVPYGTLFLRQNSDAAGAFIGLDVTVGEGVGEYVAVTEGLAAGDTIATAGAAFLAEGMQVRPWTD